MHHIPTTLMNSGHSVTIDLVGCGGTGSLMLTGLARLHTALQLLGKPGLFVRVFDHDVVSDANLGRQHFVPADLGRNKAIVSVETINRWYGTQWQGIPTKVETRMNRLPNILITCVDSVAARRAIGEAYKPPYPLYIKGSNSLNTRYISTDPAKGYYESSFVTPFYWLDTGNGKTFGQVVLGSWEQLAPAPQYTKQPKLPTVLERFADLETHEDAQEQGPSCSLAEALNKQDLFINPMMATTALALLWKLLHHRQTESCGAFVNLQTMEMSNLPIPVRRVRKSKKKQQTDAILEKALAA